MREWRKKHPRKHKESMRAYNKEHPMSNRDKARKSRYGITAEDYLTMLEKQKSLCAICGKTNASGKLLSVDHSHTTGIIRGLLCTNCNSLLGFAGEKTRTLSLAIKYLNKHRKENRK